MFFQRIYMLEVGLLETKKKCIKYHRCFDKNIVYMNYRMFKSPRIDREKQETKKGGAIKSFIEVTLY